MHPVQSKNSSRHVPSSRPGDRLRWGVFIGGHLDDIGEPAVSTAHYLVGRAASLASDERGQMKPLTTTIILALAVALAVLGYLYYERTRNDVTIELPKVQIK